MKTVTWLDSDGHFNVWSLDNLSATRRYQIALELSEADFMDEILSDVELTELENVTILTNEEFICLLENLSSRGTLEIVEVQ